MRRLIPFTLLLALVLAACASEPNGGSGDAADDASGAGATEPAGTEPGGADSAGSASCVEEYSLQTLRNREFAFDGTVTEVRLADPEEPVSSDEEPPSDRVRFAVNRWYRGDGAGSVTLRAYGTGGITSAGSLSIEEGERLLVAGDADFLWLCGFTQPYSAEASAEWEAALQS